MHTISGKKWPVFLKTLFLEKLCKTFSYSFINKNKKNHRKEEIIKESQSLE